MRPRCLGLFLVHPDPDHPSAQGASVDNDHDPDERITTEFVIETPSDLQVPALDPDCVCSKDQPPKCYHGRASRPQTVRRDSANHGRVFFTCTWPEGSRCSFFRWQDENQNYTDIVMRPPLTADQVMQETAQAVDGDLQLRSWAGLQQGTPEWHRLRACRITASNFGSVNSTNSSFCTPVDMLRQLLWPFNMESTAMKYGSSNEKVALRRFHEFIAMHLPTADLPVFVDEPGIWLSSDHPYLAGSPDGVIYETLAFRVTLRESDENHPRDGWPPPASGAAAAPSSRSSPPAGDVLSDSPAPFDTLQASQARARGRLLQQQPSAQRPRVGVFFTNTCQSRLRPLGPHPQLVLRPDPGEPPEGCPLWWQTPPPSTCA